MPGRSDIAWFKATFGRQIEAAVGGTVFDVNFLTAIACQETGEIWPTLRRDPTLSVDRILELCVGDTIDAKPGGGGRKAFPKTKADLVAAKDGAAMFEIARQALVDMARYIPAYRDVAKKPGKFCHGYGLFQYDLQFFKVDPAYFLTRRYAIFGETLGKCLQELRNALKKLGWANRTSLSDLERAHVGIAYNTGGFNPAKGLKQGYFNGSRYYGEQLYDFIQLARTVPMDPSAPPDIPTPPPGHAILPPPTPVTATGGAYVVDTRESTLRVRSAPAISTPPTANVIGELPDGHPVRAVTGLERNGFLEIETSLSGGLLRGWSSAKYLVASGPGTAPVPVVAPESTPPGDGIVAVAMPRKAGTITRRIDPAGAHSLNEPGQPGRTGSSAGELRAELAAIVAWLAVDKVANKRYQPHDGLTFCNIYAHDFCALAGVYLPRVWWTPRAIERLAQGQAVTPKYGDTIAEVRANDLFRWLRDFGLRFGWRQTGTLDKLQQAANQGGIGVVVARRKEDGRSGHIVMVVPETAEHSARRDASGVTAPLQSQAGAVNFQYGTGTANWWKGAQFAESAFWIHA